MGDLQHETPLSRMAQTEKTGMQMGAPIHLLSDTLLSIDGKRCQVPLSIENVSVLLCVVLSGLKVDDKRPRTFDLCYMVHV